jgi:hypothetical protein
MPVVVAALRTLLVVLAVLVVVALVGQTLWEPLELPILVAAVEAVVCHLLVPLAAAVL